MKRTTYLLLAILLFAAACGGKKTTKTEELIQLKKDRAKLDQQIAALEAEVAKNDTSIKATPVAIMTLAPQEFDAFVEVQAQITGDENVLATPQAPGVVKNIIVSVGQRVSRGQTLAYLDDAAIDQQVATADANLRLQRELYEKQQRLWAQKIGTQVQLLQAKTAYETAQTQKQALIAQRNMYTIKSPISGVVDAITIKEGDMANPGGMGTTGIRVVSKEKLKALATLGENYIGKVQTGDRVTLVFPDMNDSMQTKLSYVAQSVDPISRSFNVEVRLGTNARLRPNMSAKMRIANYENNTALVIPVAAIQKTADGDMVYIAEGNKARAVIIQTGKNSNGMVEVLGGLNAGDRVITAGYEDLESGELIAVK